MITKEQHNINKLIRWAQKKGYSVVFNSTCNDEINFDDKIISINNRISERSQLHALLHECGHILDDSIEIFDEVSNKKAEKNKKYHFDVINKEIKAWERGKKLAKRLRIYLDEEKFDKDMSKYVFTYISYAYKCLKKT